MAFGSSLLNLIQARRSIRRYLADVVERDKIMTCLEAARLAPSAQNIQPWRFLVIDDPKLKERLAGEAFSGIYYATKFAAQAPVLVVILAKLDIVAHRIGRHIQKIPFWLIDIGIAGEHFVLQAQELGLSTCWIGWFNAEKTRKALEIPRNYKIAALLALGYEAGRPPLETIRRPLEEIAWFNKIGE